MRQSPLLAMLIVGLAACGLAACAADRPTPAPGSDRDAHGCIASAGYSWCATTNRCERPWELAAARGFAATPEAFAAYCRTPAR